MERWITYDWLRKFTNLYRNASYADKLAQLRAEKNAYYLLEWLLFPPSSTIVEELRYPRSPGMWKNSYVSFHEVFFQQLLFEIAFAAMTDADEEPLLDSAIFDMKLHYRSGIWEQAVEAFGRRMGDSVEKHGLFAQQLRKDYDKLDNECKEQIRQIDIEYASDEEQQRERKRAAFESFERKKEDTPRNLLAKPYAEWPFVAFIHMKQWDRPELRVQDLVDRLRAAAGPSYDVAIRQERYEKLREDILPLPQERKRFMRWLTAYASKTNMTRGTIDPEPRQMVLAKLLGDRDAFNGFPEARNELLAIVYETIGFEDFIVAGDELPAYFPELVRWSLSDGKRRRWLQDKIILRHWSVFADLFAQPKYSFDSLSWVLCLDPISIEQRLLRLDRSASERSGRFDRASIMERCCDIFTDGIKAGLPNSLMVPIFAYLTAHGKDTVYAYIYKIKQPAELAPLLELDMPSASSLFGGDGVRAQSARQAIGDVFLQWSGTASGEDRDRFLRLGKLLAEEKEQLAVRWLDRLSADGEPLRWPAAQASLLAEALGVRFIGTPDSQRDDDALVRDWLGRHSERIKFETDAAGALSSAQSVKYRIIRPGALDEWSGQVIARMIVRAEISDKKQIVDLLDDLRSI